MKERCLSDLSEHCRVPEDAVWQRVNITGVRITWPGFITLQKVSLGLAMERKTSPQGLEGNSRDLSSYKKLWSKRGKDLFLDNH